MSHGIRFNIKDRVTGKVMKLDAPSIIVSHKKDKKGKVLSTEVHAELKQEQKLKEIIKVCSAVGLTDHSHYYKAA
jgi:hypothetical protein